MSYGYLEAMRETGTGAFILKILRHIFTRKFNAYGKAVYTTDVSSGPKVAKTHSSYRECTNRPDFDSTYCCNCFTYMYPSGEKYEQEEIFAFS